MSEATTLLVKVDTPSVQGVRYTTEDLERLAALYPDKLEFKEGCLHSRTPLEDEQHLFRWEMSLKHHIGQFYEEKKKEAIKSVLTGVEELEKQLETRFNLHLSEADVDDLEEVVRRLKYMLECYC